MVCDGVRTFRAVTAEYECFGVCLCISFVCVCVAFVVGGVCASVRPGSSSPHPHRSLHNPRPDPPTAPSPQPDGFPALLTWSP